MAYTDLEKRDIAREIARAGGNLSAATKRLRDEYDTFELISESTVARVMKGPGVAQIIAEEGQKLREAIDAGRAIAERDRARREAEGLIVNRLARDEHMLDDARKMLEEKLKSTKPEDLKEATQVFQALANIIDRRHARSVPAIASIQEAAALVESVAEVLNAKLGARAKEIIDAIKARYIEKIQAAQNAEQTQHITESAT